MIKGTALLVSFMLSQVSAAGAEPREIEVVQNVDQVFIGFPHRGDIVEPDAFEESDRAAATQYYERMFVGKSAAEVQELCLNEARREELGETDAHAIRCNIPGDDPRSGYLSYRFGLKESADGPVVASLLWEIDVTIDDERISGVSAAHSILAP